MHNAPCSRIVTRAVVRGQTHNVQRDEERKVHLEERRRWHKPMEDAERSAVQTKNEWKRVPERRAPATHVVAEQQQGPCQNRPHHGSLVGLLSIEQQCCMERRRADADQDHTKKLKDESLLTSVLCRLYQAKSTEEAKRKRRQRVPKLGNVPGDGVVVLAPVDCRGGAPKVGH
eukprot:Amastigsp_a4440_101.p2 type:complete len:173 gc:universal Amastigsp_a4440_101:592-1110(+)